MGGGLLHHQKIKKKKVYLIRPYENVGKEITKTGKNKPIQPLSVRFYGLNTIFQLGQP